MRSDFVVAAIAWLPRWMQCVVGLHEDLLLREPARLRVQCIHCMRLTKGLALR